MLRYYYRLPFALGLKPYPSLSFLSQFPQDSVITLSFHLLEMIDWLMTELNLHVRAAWKITGAAIAKSKCVNSTRLGNPLAVILHPEWMNVFLPCLGTSVPIYPFFLHVYVDIIPICVLASFNQDHLWSRRKGLHQRVTKATYYHILRFRDPLPMPLLHTRDAHFVSDFRQVFLHFKLLLDSYFFPPVGNVWCFLGPSFRSFLHFYFYSFLEARFPLAFIESIL